MFGLPSASLFGGFVAASTVAPAANTRIKKPSTHRYPKMSRFAKKLNDFGTLLGYRLRGMPLTRHGYPNLQPLDTETGTYYDVFTYGGKYSHFLISITSENSDNTRFWKDRNGNRDWCQKAYGKEISYTGDYGLASVFKRCSISGTYPSDSPELEGLVPTPLPISTLPWVM